MSEEAVSSTFADVGTGAPSATAGFVCELNILLVFCSLEIDVFCKVC